MSNIFHAVLGITTSKNPEILMIKTSGGTFPYRTASVKKAGITNENGVFNTPAGSIVEIRNIKKGQYIYGGDGTATQDSSRVHPEGHKDAGLPVYYKGDKPIAENDFSIVMNITPGAAGSTLEAVQLCKAMNG